MKKTVGIIFLGDFFVDSRCINMVDSILNSGNDAWVIDLNNNSSESNYRNSKIYHVNLKCKKNSPFRFFYFYKNASSILKNLQFDILIAGDLFSLSLVCKYYKKKIRLVYDSRELYTKLAGLSKKPLNQIFWSFFEKHFIKKVNVIMVTAKTDGQYLKSLYGNLNIKLIKNLPPQKLSPSRNNKLRDILKNYNSKILLYQGGLQQGRGLKSMINLLPHLKNCITVLIGSGTMKQELLDYAVKKGVSDRFFIINSVPYEDLLNLTAGADIGFALIEPYSQSYIQALPNKLFEYLLAEIPVIVSNFPEMEKVVEKYKVGRAVEPYNLMKQIEVIKEMLKESNYKKYVQNISKCNLIWESQHKLFINDVLSL
ncbi:MAG: glycosyltransferase [Pelagibacterales bacterium]|nr:glycosyltransferase [Pelagibacterales bacterium]